MPEKFDNRNLINRETLAKLRVKQDIRSLWKLTAHLGLFFGCLFILTTVELPLIVSIPTLLFFGFLIFSLYAPLHECTHDTAFKSQIFNDIGGWITGIIYGYSPGMHRGFHFHHHRYTNKKEDPEKGFSLPDDFPFRTVFLLLVVGILGMLVPIHSIILSFFPTSKWDSLEAAWAPRKERHKLAWECRIVAACWFGFAFLLSQNLTLMLYVVIGIFLGDTFIT